MLIAGQTGHPINIYGQGPTQSYEKIYQVQAPAYGAYDRPTYAYDRLQGWRGGGARFRTLCACPVEKGAKGQVNKKMAAATT